MELTIKNRKTGLEIIVPTNCTATLEANLVIIEPKKTENEPAFKDGDVCFSKNDCCNMIYIYNQREDEHSNRIYYYALIVPDDNDLMYGGYCTIERYGKPNRRHATPEEKQILFDALEKEGEAWDADNKEIVDLKYMPKSEFNKSGYEYDFETHTAKKLEWKPKVGDTYWTVSPAGISDFKRDNGNSDKKFYMQGIVFKTEHLAQLAFDKLNELLKGLQKS